MREVQVPRPACGPEVVRDQVGIEEFSLSPDGLTALYVRRHVDGLHYRSHVWAVDLEGGEPRQLTNGDVRDSSPTISPDGRRLAFVRTAQDADHGQPWTMPVEGGEPARLASMPHGATSLSWSPNGRWLAVLAPSANDLPFLIGPQEGSKAPTARRMNRLDWRDDDEGHHDRRSHLFLVGVAGDSAPRQLTEGDWDVTHPAWSPDSSAIAFVTDQREQRDLDPRSSIWVVDISGGEPREVAALAGAADHPHWSPDSRRLAFLACDIDDAPEYEPSDVWLVERDGGALRRVKLQSEGLAGTWAWSELDLIYGSPGPFWLDEANLALLVTWRARCNAWRIPLDGGPQAPLFDADGVISSGLAVSAGRVLVSATIDGRAAELYAVEDGLRRVTSDGSAWQDRCPRPQMVEVEVPGPAGSINTWVLSPAGAADTPLPTVIHFHGGPTGSFGPGSSLDGLVWAAAGYRVVMPNLRGSAGFGREWADGLAGSWGEADAEDALAVVDWVVDSGLADASRIGIYGLSYGGFLVNWLIGATDRFAAAVSENGVTNQVSTWSNSYFGVHYNRRYRLGDPLSAEGVAKLWSSSPLSLVARINTPLLILQAEEDRICPAPDAEQLFTALRTLGRTVEYVLYPEEHHEFKVYGRPDRRIDRLERVLDWFERYLR